MEWSCNNTEHFSFSFFVIIYLAIFASMNTAIYGVGHLISSNYTIFHSKSSTVKMKHWHAKVVYHISILVHTVWIMRVINNLNDLLYKSAYNSMDSSTSMYVSARWIHRLAPTDCTWLKSRALLSWITVSITLHFGSSTCMVSWKVLELC